jgi:hypothetical protein
MTQRSTRPYQPLLSPDLLCAFVVSLLPLILLLAQTGVQPDKYLKW